MHNPLYQKAAIVKRQEQHCTGDETLVLRPRVDWMEWQASYAAGALLMPLSRLKLVAAACVGKINLAPVPAESTRATDLKQRVSEAFLVSADAAAVRLIQLGYLANAES